MQKIINLIQKKADVREILLYTCMYLVLLLLENINGNIEEFYTSKFSLKFNNSINLQILEKSTKLELVDYENPETYDFINRAKSQNGSSILAYPKRALLEECKSIRKSVEDKFKDYCVLKMYDYQR